MTRSIAKRGEVLAYAASVIVIAGLMTVVALGGSAPKRGVVEFNTASVAAQ